MAQYISSLALGNKIKDSRGNQFVVIAKDHYVSNSVLLMHTSPTFMKGFGITSNPSIEYSNSDTDFFLRGTNYLNSLESSLVNSMLTISLPTWNGLTTNHHNTKAFILSTKEIGLGTSTHTTEKKITYVVNNLKKLYSQEDGTWTRTKNQAGTQAGKSYFEYYYTSIPLGYDGAMLNKNIVPVFNLPSSVRVSDSASGGYYSFVFDNPPVINTIPNVSTNFGSPAEITYTATDDITANLTHSISFDNGSSWTQITPSKNGTKYTHFYDAGSVGTYSCRIKVVDGAGNSTTSNLFTITVNATAPTVNIISVADKVISFKVNCLTHSISKVEVLVNDNLMETYLSGFDSILSYEIDKDILNIGENTMKIKATSTEDLEGYRDAEINKELYSLPPAGTKVVIGEDVYTIEIARQEGSNQVYSFGENLLNNVSKGQEIKVTQDTVKVLCSLSNLENVKDFKEMKLVKTKKLKGQFEGYVEEKYELERQGRYSSIKIEAERFNNNVESEIIELQQYFDYMEE